MKLLHIDSSITGAGSVSRSLSSAIVTRMTAAHPSLTVVRRDLAQEPLPHIDLASLPSGASEAAAASAVVLQEFLDADTVVIGAPMYNFGLPSQLKAWIDRIIVAGKTFSYTPSGPQGLAGGKRVIVAVSRGSYYGAESPTAALEHVESYLAGVFAFIGARPEFVVAEGLMVGPDQRAAALATAEGAIAALALEASPMLQEA